MSIEPAIEPMPSGNGHDPMPPPVEAVVPEPSPARTKIERKIAIFGTTPSRMEGPVQDNTGWERWTIGPGGKDVHNWERLFEIHGVWPADFEGYLNDLSLIKPPRQLMTLPQPGNEAQTWAGAIERWHKTHNKPHGTLKGDWSGLVPYPRDHILARYGRRMWFSSTISWCIALAIEEGATDIGLWGIDLESGEEYIAQHIGCAFFMDLARLVGINIHVPKDCGLLRDPAPYPDKYETHLAMTFEKKDKWIQMQMAQLRPQLDQQRGEMHRAEGRLLLLRELGAPPEKIQEAEAVIINTQNACAQIACNIQTLQGELNATQFYRSRYVYGLTDPNGPA